MRVGIWLQSRSLGEEVTDVVHGSADCKDKQDGEDQVKEHWCAFRVDGVSLEAM
jgi:hypothetical protein